MHKLEDVVAGHLELTMSERGLILHALSELYVRGGWAPSYVQDRRALHKRTAAKIANLPLVRMVAPEGGRLVSVEEHEAIVEFLLSG